MFAELLTTDARAIQARFDEVLQAFDPVPVRDAMIHATAGGKRLRGFLALESARIHDIDPKRALWPAMAIEAVHAYSLVHDDLPCMDDDDLRRGLPTVHKKWDEATAVLAGDALQSLAFEMVTHPEIGDADIRVDLTTSLARASGARGMVLGQALDMAAETAEQPLDLSQIVRLQNGKTGALIIWAATVGARLARVDTGPLGIYGEALGLAFQIADDVLDVTADSQSMGKATQKDAEAGKATFVSLLGLEGAQSKARALVDQACDAIGCYGARAGLLQDAARFTISRAS